MHHASMKQIYRKSLNITDHIELSTKFNAFLVKIVDNARKSEDKTP